MVGPPPLKGVKVLEFAGLAPGPFAGMLLSDAGASVLRVDRASVAVDLKSPAGLAFVKRLAERADVLIDPFRPGVLEKLGLGPEVLEKANRGLIYGRMTGFRRDGRYKDMAGHDINYLAVSGALSMLGRDGEKPHPPWNILADFAGGGAMNMLDGGCPYYDTYETKDGKYFAVGALEPQFFAAFIKGLGLAGQGWEEERFDRARWGELRELFTKIFKSRTREEWEKVFDGTDACCTPVLEYRELETEPAREGDQRPAVTLVETPCLAVAAGEDGDPRRGQGPGVEGGGYVGVPLTPGDGGEKALEEWLGWKKGREFEVREGTWVLKEKSRL
ncbi:CoA-transferase family III [Colletotrichum scovillei]|uniref:CoA-transferase family III n=1 Tax=Colletotrichum scovillei TaxID=1209932 RepID=UPI0015C374BC|nr:CoA-transferase family III [Colletotrichum scovillei]KAF4779315.1 CoA-transferase family III [Colletotrichum scovillei]